MRYGRLLLVYYAHPPTPEEQARRRAAAEAQSWARQVDEIESHLARLLEARPQPDTL